MIQQLHSLSFTQINGKLMSIQIPAHRCFQQLCSLSAQTSKKPRCSSVGEWINKLYIQTMRYYSLLTKNKQSSYEKTWRNLIYKFVSEESQCTYYIIPTTSHSWIHSVYINSTFPSILWQTSIFSKNKVQYIEMRAVCQKFSMFYVQCVLNKWQLC